MPATAWLIDAAFGAVATDIEPLLMQHAAAQQDVRSFDPCMVCTVH